MSHLRDEAPAHIHSGEPGTTGREPFEDSSATGPGANFTTGNTGSGLTGGQGGLTGEHHGHHHGSHGAHAHGAHAHGTGIGSGVGVGSESTGLGGVGDHQRFGQTGNTGIDEATAGSGHRGVQSGATGSGIAAAVADRAGSGHHEGHHHSHQGEHGLTGQHGRDSDDRVGALGQKSANYETTGSSGPTTSGAAGTDRFDTDRHHGTGIGSHGTSGLNTDSSREFHKGENDVDRRGEGKGTGGVLGALGTTDKEFTARDRLGEGAYHDDNALFKGNKSGPGGNTALTGREGTQENNPVAQAKSRVGEDVNDVHRTSGEQVGSTAHPDQQDKGLMAKIRDHLPI